MKHLETFESFLNEANLLNESVKYYTVAWNRDNEKNRYDYLTKMMDLADKAMKALPAILEECCPGVFDTKNLGFTFRGNTALVFANFVDRERYGLYGKIEINKEFQKFFDAAGKDNSGMFSAFFRLKPVSAAPFISPKLAPRS